MPRATKALDVQPALALNFDAVTYSNSMLSASFPTETPAKTDEALFRVALTLDQEAMDLLKRAQELMGTKDLAGTVKKLADKFVAQKDPLLKKSKLKPKTTSPAAVKKEKRSRYIPAAVKHSVYRRDQGVCQYVDQATGQKCCERRYLEYDHYAQAFSLGGEHSIDNLRLMCRAHNQWRGREQFGRVG